MGLEDPTRASIGRLREAQDCGEWSAKQILEAHHQRIAADDGSLNAFLSLDDRAWAQAEAVDRDRKEGRPPGPLAGIPLAIKDNLHVSGELTTCASLMLKDYRSPVDATVIRRLREAGAVLIGKTNLDEFAMGSSTESSAFGPTQNPWNTLRTPGGSSGGSAAAVAAGMCTAALGSDTGGSIRQPASFCGITGLKPGFGRVSRSGLAAFAPSLDQVGPMTRSAEDAARLFAVLAGPDPADPMTRNASAATDWSIESDFLAGKRLGVPKEFFGEGLDDDVAGVIRQSLSRLEEAGALLVDVSLPHQEFAIPAYYLIATAEVSSSLARMDGISLGRRAVVDGRQSEVMAGSRGRHFGDEVKRRIMLGTFNLSAGAYEDYYGRALRARKILAQDFEQAFACCDLIVGPTSPIPPFRLGEKIDDPLAMYLADLYTVSLNLAGLPGASVPAGFIEDPDGPLPVGLQIIGPHRSEAEILRLAAAWESISKLEQRAAMR